MIEFPTPGTPGPSFCAGRASGGAPLSLAYRKQPDVCECFQLAYRYLAVSQTIRVVNILLFS